METGGRGAPVELELLVQPIVLRRAGKHQKYHGVVLLYIESFSENIGKLEETLESQQGNYVITRLPFIRSHNKAPEMPATSPSFPELQDLEPPLQRRVRSQSLDLKFRGDHC